MKRNLPHLGRSVIAALFVLGAGGAAAAPESEAPKVAESYKLPISPPRDQGDSGLCWIFATLSMLETNYRVRHPGATVAFSRGALQRATIADRLRRVVTSNVVYLQDGGVAVDALALIHDEGLVDERDFHDFVDSDAAFSALAPSVGGAAPAPARLAALGAALDRRLGPAPLKTRLDGKPLSPKELAQAVLGRQIWREYDVARDGRTGPRASVDPDARPGLQVEYTSLSAVADLIHRSLKSGQSVVYGTSDHDMLIFGADYDAAGRPLAYWIKDSFAPYVRREPALAVENAMTDVTVAVAPAGEDASAAR